MFTERYLSELRRFVRRVTGGSKEDTDQDIVVCANEYFPDCDLIPLATELLDVGTHFGYPWEVVRWKFIRGREDHTVLIMRYKLSIRRRLGRRIGQDKFLFQRRFTHENGYLVANHDYLVLPSRLQGGNISRILNRIMYDFYKKYNINMIKVYAGFEAGGYTWATAGFFAVRKDEVYAIIAQNRKRVSTGKTIGLSFALIENFKLLADAHYEEYPNRSFPMYTWVEQEGGKEFLLGTDWHGELDIAEPEQRIIFETYLNKRT